jgi:hypothetical protein
MKWQISLKFAAALLKYLRVWINGLQDNLALPQNSNFFLKFSKYIIALSLTCFNIFLLSKKANLIIDEAVNI